MRLSRENGATGWLLAICLTGYGWAGCGWVPGLGGAPEVVDVYGACAAWVQQINTMDPCVSVTYDAENLCAAADSQPREMGPYYQCLTETAHCEGAEPKLGPPQCVPPLVALAPPEDRAVSR